MRTADTCTGPDNPNFRQVGLGLAYSWQCGKCGKGLMSTLGSREFSYRGARIRVGTCCAHLAPEPKRRKR